VVRTKRKIRLNQTLLMPATPVDYKVSYPGISALSDRDMTLIKDVLQLVRRTGNTMLALDTMRRVETIARITSHHEPIDFLQIALNDYNHLASL